jgi:hypothetical protein
MGETPGDRPILAGYRGFFKYGRPGFCLAFRTTAAYNGSVGGYSVVDMDQFDATVILDYFRGFQHVGVR